MIHKKLFTTADLDASYVLTYQHNLNNEDIIVKWYDADGYEQILVGLLRIVDVNTIELNCGGDIVGTHKLLISYEATVTLAGEHLFGLDLRNTEPESDARIAIGFPLSKAYNVRWSKLKQILQAGLDYCLRDGSNLTTTNKPIFRSNLGVYSTSQVDAAVASKATLLHPSSGYALGTANTMEYNPTQDHHPATLKAITDRVPTLYFAGTVTAAGVWTQLKGSGAGYGTSKSATGQYLFSHMFNSLNYIVIVQATQIGDQSFIVAKGLNNFIVHAQQQTNYYDVPFDIIIYTF